MIAGLELPDGGHILWEGENLAPTPAHLRDFGLVFQDYALFPHLDVFDNVAYGLKMKRRRVESIRQRVSEVLELVSLRGFEHRDVTELSGGEQQRVALARALAPRPRLLMFDEPLGALDRALRESLVMQLRHILQQAHLPAIYVTHDQEEASAIADRVLLLHEGKIVRAGPAADVWSHPGSVWAAEFLGVGYVMDGTVMDREGYVGTRYGDLHVPCAHAYTAGERIQLLVRPVPTDGGTEIQGRVADVVFERDWFRVTLEGGLFIYMKVAPEIGRTVSAKVQLECLE
jgi:ABC-type Fe3+/spermidine/putrescine transport system ATPase subunit